MVFKVDAQKSSVNRQLQKPAVVAKRFGKGDFFLPPLLMFFVLLELLLQCVCMYVRQCVCVCVVVGVGDDDADIAIVDSGDCWG